MAETTAPAPVREGTAARAVRRLMEVGDAVRQSYARRLGLGRSGYLALSCIYCEGPIQPRELGARLGMGSGTLTPLLDGLEQRGYAARTDHPLDRRGLLIVVTPQGRAAMDEAFAEFDGVVSAALAGIGSGVGLGEFSGLVERLSDALAARMEVSNLGEGSAAAGA